MRSAGACMGLCVCVCWHACMHACEPVGWLTAHRPGQLQKNSSISSLPTGILRLCGTLLSCSAQVPDPACVPSTTHCLPVPMVSTEQLTTPAAPAAAPAQRRSASRRAGKRQASSRVGNGHRTEQVRGAPRHSFLFVCLAKTILLLQCQLLLLGRSTAVLAWHVIPGSTAREQGLLLGAEQLGL